MRIVLYSRRECCLCDEAQAVLAQHGLRAEVVDVDAHPDLRRRYGDCVPVVEIDGRVRFRGRISPLLLRRITARAG